MTVSRKPRGRPSRGPRRAYAYRGVVGCVVRHRSRVTGCEVGIYDAAAAGIETDPTLPWAVVCEPHGSVLGFETLSLAREFASEPTAWCEACREGGAAAAPREED